MGQEKNFSSSDLDWAGHKIYAGTDTAVDRVLFEEWREAHLAPIVKLRGELKRCLKNHKNVQIVARLKSKSAIFGEINEKPRINLSQIQDVGKIQVVIPDGLDILRKVIKETERYFCDDIVDRKDYTKSRRSDGFRGAKLFYRYKPGNITIEIQLQTAYQHLWSVSQEFVRAVRVFKKIEEKDSLKKSTTREEVLRDFRRSLNQKACLGSWEFLQDLYDGREASYWERFGLTFSRALESIENVERDGLKPNCLSEVDLDHYILAATELASLEKKLNFMNLFEGLHKSFDVLRKNQVAHSQFFIVCVKRDKKVEIREFKRTEAGKIFEIYREYERDKDFISVNLFCADSFRALMRLYPNYTADTAYMRKVLRLILRFQHKFKDVRVER